MRQFEKYWDFIIRGSIKNRKCVSNSRNKVVVPLSVEHVTNCIWPILQNNYIRCISCYISSDYKRSSHNLLFCTSILNITVFNLTVIIVIITDWNTCNKLIYVSHTSDLLRYLRFIIANCNWMWIEYLAALFAIYYVLLDYAIMKVPWNPIEIAEIR